MTATPGRAAGALVLIGPMGAGKTSVGRRVARATGARFRDTDREIARVHGPIPDIFREHGEAGFRAIEREVVRETLDGRGVVALGGGAVLDASTQELLARHRVVFLDVSPLVVARRVEGSSRPLLVGGEEDPMVRWRAIYDERRPLYARLADLEIDTSHGPMSGHIDRILDWVQKHPEPAA